MSEARLICEPAIGHNNPTTALGVYINLFDATDERAASIVEATLSGLLRE